MPMLAMLIWGAGALLLRLPFSAQIAAAFLSLFSLARGARPEAINSAFARKVRGPSRPHSETRTPKAAKPLNSLPRGRAAG